MMKKLVMGISFCVATAVGFGQQLFQQTQFMVNPYTLNPALAGSEDFFDIKMGYRNQWLGFQDTDGYIGSPITPRTMYLSGHTALGHDHGYYKDPRHEHKAFHGVGAFVVSDQLGAFSSNSAYGSYSYNMKLLKGNDNGQKYGFNGKDRHIGVRMIIGTHLGMVQSIIDNNKLAPNDQISGQPTLDGYDPYLGSVLGSINGWSPDASLGTWIYSNNYYIGGTIRRILGNEAKINNPGVDFNGIRLARHYNVMAGYKFMMSDFILIEPSLNIKAEAGARPSVDLNAQLVYDNTYTNSRGAASSKNADLHVYTGFTYRPGAAIAVMVGGVIEKRYEIVYSFDIATNTLNNYQVGTHEITLGLRLPPPAKFFTAEGKLQHSGMKHH